MAPQCQRRALGTEDFKPEAAAWSAAARSRGALPVAAQPPESAKGEHGYTLKRVGFPASVTVRLNQKSFYVKPAPFAQANALIVDKAGGCYVKWNSDPKAAWNKVVEVAGWDVM